MGSLFIENGPMSFWGDLRDKLIDECGDIFFCGAVGIRRLGREPVRRGGRPGDDPRHRRQRPCHVRGRHRLQPRWAKSSATLEFVSMLGGHDRLTSCSPPKPTPGSRQQPQEAPLPAAASKTSRSKLAGSPTSSSPSTRSSSSPIPAWKRPSRSTCGSSTPGSPEGLRARRAAVASAPEPRG